MAGIEEILMALRQGGLPQGNIPQASMPILAGLGASQNFLTQLSPGLAQLVSPGAFQAFGLPPFRSLDVPGVLSGLPPRNPVRG